MKHAFCEKFIRQYKALPPSLKAKIDKQIAFLVANLHHPSLRAKKYDEANDVWQARVDASYRFYFRIEGDTYQILSVAPHPK
jgi:mRNA-degrading endonuclease RelE of RelBE toxin-antitoxin system